MIVVWTLLAIYVVVVVAVAWISVHPVRTPLFISPGAMGAPQRDVEFPSLDGTKLRAWWIDHPSLEEKGRPTVAILSHGYLMTRSELTPLAVRLWQEGCSCLLVDLRAHGRSGGRVCGVGWLERQDVIAAIRWVRERHPEARILLAGSSMGAAASAFAAGEEPVDALILDCAYDRMTSAALGWWRFIGGQPLAIAFAPTVLFAMPMVGVNPFRIRVSPALKRADVPTLLIHGSRDKLALPSEAERNLAACGDKGKLVWMPDSDHAEGRWLHPELYSASVLSFLRENDLI